MKAQSKPKNLRKTRKFTQTFAPVKISFQSHLLEIRARLLWFIVALGVGTGIGYYFNAEILMILLKPSQGPLFYTTPAGGLDFVFKTSLFFGILFSLPFLIYHITRFVEPILPTKSVYFVAKFFIFSTLLMLFGMSLAYFVSLPGVLLFLSQFGNEQIHSLISTDAYFSFVTRYILGFGVLFELPLFLLLINSFYPLSMKLLFSYQKYVILASFILAGIITPTPDFFNQLVMALPILGLYQISILIIYFVNRTGVKS